MLNLRRIGLFVLIAALLIAAGLYAGRLFPRHADKAETSVSASDSTGYAGWKRAHPWLFQNGPAAVWREDLILPYARDHALGPKSLKRQGDAVEFSLPHGRPLQEYAYDFEAQCEKRGIRVVEGVETPGGEGKVEYRVRADSAGPVLTVRLVFGSAILQGTARMALVITGLDGSAPELQAWLGFPGAVTVVLPDTGVLPDLGKKEAAKKIPAGKQILVELPMEPSTYPYDKPGPRALFIHHTKAEVNRILGGRVKALPMAAGFATRLGDRAIENRPLMENVFAFAASKSLIFVDLTGSNRGLTSALGLETGAETFVATPQDAAKKDADLEAELLRRAALAAKTGEGVWVLRDEPGLPRRLAALFRADAGRFSELGLKWVPIKEVHAEKTDD